MPRYVAHKPDIAGDKFRLPASRSVEKVWRVDDISDDNVDDSRASLHHQLQNDTNFPSCLVTPSARAYGSEG